MTRLNIYRKLDPKRDDYMTIDPKFYIGTAIWPILVAIVNSGNPSSLDPKIYVMLSVISGLFGLKIGTVYHKWKRWLLSWNFEWIDDKAPKRLSNKSISAKKRSKAKVMKLSKNEKNIRKLSNTKKRVSNNRFKVSKTKKRVSKNRSKPSKTKKRISKTKKR